MLYFLYEFVSSINKYYIPPFRPIYIKNIYIYIIKEFQIIIKKINKKIWKNGDMVLI